MLISGFHGKQSISWMILGFFLLLSFINVHGQSTGNNLYTVFDRVAGFENSGLFNGVQYIEQHRTINEKHKFFLTRDFTPGSLMYNNQFFPDIELKYNIFDGIVLVSAKQENGSTVLQLINEKIERFIIEDPLLGDHIFVNLKDNRAQELGVNGFYEELLKNDIFGLYKKYSKQINKRRDSNMVYYEFDDQKNNHLLYYNDSYHSINSRRDVQRLFPDLKSDIKRIFKSNRSLRKTNKDKFMALLFQEITSLLSKENTNRK